MRRHEGKGMIARCTVSSEEQACMFAALNDRSLIRGTRRRELKRDKYHEARAPSTFHREVSVLRQAFRGTGKWRE